MRTFSIADTAKIFVCSEPTSMALGFPRLSEMLIKSKGYKSGDCAIFWNKRMTYIKVIYFHTGGWSMFCKKLPQGKFSIPEGPAIPMARMVDLIEHVVVAKPKTVAISKKANGRKAA